MNYLRRPRVLYFLVYFGVLSILRWQINWSVLLLWLGGVLGMFFFWADRLAHVYFTRPFEQLSLQVKGLLAERRFKEALLLLEQRKNEQRHLSVRSALFLALWVPLAFFVITSTGSVLAVGMVMAIGLSAVIDMQTDFSHLEKLKWWLFWQIKRNFSDTETKYFVAIFSTLFVLLSLLIV
jgi:hypothetical protein